MWGWHFLTNATFKHSVHFPIFVHKWLCPSGNASQFMSRYPCLSTPFVVNSMTGLSFQTSEGPLYFSCMSALWASCCIKNSAGGLVVFAANNTAIKCGTAPPLLPTSSSTRMLLCSKVGAWGAATKQFICESGAIGWSRQWVTISVPDGAKVSENGARWCMS